MSKTNVRILVPLVLTDAMVTSSTIAEPASGETAWASGTYAIDAERVSAHGIYVCVQAHAGRTTTPDKDPNYWQYKQPSQKWAALDRNISTQSRGITPLTYVLRPGFINALALYGLDGVNYTVTVKSTPGGTVTQTFTGILQEPPLDLYDWAFGRIKTLSKLVITDIVPYPDMEITITITAATGVEVGLALIAVGDMRLLLGDDAEWGGPEYGATAEPLSYSYPDIDKWGNYKLASGAAVNGMSLDIAMPQTSADYVVATLLEVLGQAAAVIATNVPGYDALNVFGKVTGSVRYEGPTHAKLNLKVQGIINAS